MKVFLSYVHEDKALADQLASYLKDSSFEIWRDENVSAGEAWANAVQDALCKAETVLLIVPATDSPGRNNVFFEIGAARALGKRILAVVPDRHETEPQDIPIDVADLVIMDAAHRPIDEVAATLRTALQGSTK